MTATIAERTGTEVPGTSITSLWMEVTPAKAEEWLKDNDKNRHLKTKHLDRLKKDMQREMFVITHQGVAICEDGTLIDGQHRLMAIKETRKSQWMLVTLGLPMEAQQYVDNGSRRQPGDLGPLKEGGYGAMKAAATKILLSIEEMDDKISPASISTMSNNFTYGDLVSGYVRYEDLIEKNIDLARAAGKPLVGKVGGSQLLAAAVYYPEGGAEFLTGLATGANLRVGDPRLALLKFRGPGRVQVPVSSFVAFKAARYFHFNKELSVIRYRWNEQIPLLKKPVESGPWGGKRVKGQKVNPDE